VERSKQTRDAAPTASALHRPAGRAASGADPVLITPESAGWSFAGLRVVRLAPGAFLEVERLATGLPNDSVPFARRGLFHRADLALRFLDFTERFRFVQGSPGRAHRSTLFKGLERIVRDA